MKILDHAVGSGHFLVVAFDLLFALYLEEATHRNEKGDGRWTGKAIVESILENNLHGIDLDPRAVQIAAASLWIKSRTVCADSRPSRVNLVASNLGISRLPDNDPSLVELRKSIEDDTGVPAKLTNQIIEALRGADHLGSLLKIDAAIEKTIDDYQVELGGDENIKQLKLFSDGRVEQQSLPFPKERVKKNLLLAIETFLARHSSAEELGLRLCGEQFAAGVRFLRMLKVATYELVVGNPPYQGTNKLQESTWYERNYTIARSDLFAGMTVRAIELLRPGGSCAMIALSNWMFLTSFFEFRSYVLSHQLSALADLGKAAFSEGGTLISTACYVIRNLEGRDLNSVAIRPMSPQEVRRDTEQPRRAESSLLMHRGRYNFNPNALRVVPEWPLVYWWSAKFLLDYEKAGIIGATTPASKGVCTSNNSRYIRRPWEVSPADGPKLDMKSGREPHNWAPYVMGASGRAWIEPISYVLEWSKHGLNVKTLNEHIYGSFSRTIQNQNLYFRRGVAFTTIGASFAGRAFRTNSIFDTTGCSVFGADIESTTCLFNSRRAKDVLESLNPTIHFTNGDVNRLPLFEISNSKEIFSLVERAFAIHESHREPSVEFTEPGHSSWMCIQTWAQMAVDRAEGEPLPEYVEQFDPEPPTDHLSFALGVVLGRFGPNGQGVLDPNSGLVKRALPNGILFLDGSLDENDDRDSLAQTAAELLRTAWTKYGSAIDAKRDLRTWLRLNFFADVHKTMYENRPIHWPLSSRNKTFVAWINIHRWNSNTLRSLLADHLQGNALPRIDGELEDLRKARAEGAKGSDARFLQVQKWKDELDEFIALVKECSEKGPPPTDDKCPKREIDARYDPNLDDGVMINSTALWPLLEPQWKDPKKWWKEFAVASSKGNKDYDWSHLAMRYFPKRVDEKCKKDPSLGVAHGCFWKYHPAKAWAWELRLQDEIGPDFRIEESSYRGDGGDVEHRAAYLRDHALEAIAAIEKEVLRRRKDAPGKIIQEMTILESGLWSAEPEACWDMETRIIKKQEFGFRLIAPDEAEARAKLIAETPQKEIGRRRMLEGKGGSATYLAGWEEAVENS